MIVQETCPQGRKIRILTISRINDGAFAKKKTMLRFVIQWHSLDSVRVYKIPVPGKDEDFSYSVFIHTNLAFLLC